MRRLGVDEAGKGPVLGAMIAAAVVADPGTLSSTIDDSKHLTPDTRASLAADLHSNADIDIGIGYVPVQAIDDPGTDMNTLTVQAHAAAIEAVPRQASEGLLDAGDVDAGRFARRVAAAVESPPTLEAEHRADETDPVVGAASIIAKVTRDAHITHIGDSYDYDIGSGYPSDPQTKTFLTEYVDTHDHLPACARRSWQTSEDVLTTVTQTDVTEF